MNIARAAEIDPWPRYGLVAKYKPFILSRIKPFLENNRDLNRNEVITDAIRITWEAGQKFKQELGYDFSTYLRQNQRGTRRSRTSSRPSPCNSEAAGMVPGWCSTPAF